ncbi:site-specific DNA-methyltransferase [Flavobacterium psychrophilum]|nr:site-specific DNA-methyltransferase [Flavobacterium psychrophilum]
MNKQELISKIKQLVGISQDERAYLINLVNTKKKYGLVWEDKPEDVEEQLRDNLPVLKEVKDKAIINGEDNPNHILIEGDNLHALTALTFTHEGKIDVIYIDPPYNTGNKDFKYNDSFVDKEDSYRHSKWLSFMDKRLRIAKRLLSEKGVIFISIDDNEVFQLKLLCDEVFGDNSISTLPRITKSSGKTTNKIALNHDYLLVFSNNKNEAVIEGLDHNDAGFKYVDEHFEKRGLYKLNQTLDYDSLQYSSGLDYEIELEGIKIYPGGNYEKYLARKKGKFNRADWAWRWSKDLFEFGLKNDFIVLKKSKNGNRIYTKTYLNAKIERHLNDGYQIEYFDRKKPLTSLNFTDNLYSNDNAKKELDEVLKQSIFDYPKPTSIVKTFLKTNPNKILTILDFFAGSGTTLHATMALNAEDGGNRQCILVTNNENNICEEVTYERNKRVIEGYTNAKDVAVAGLKNNNLRYFKADYVGRTKSLKNKKELTKLATELLCIKEDCYNPSPLTPESETKKVAVFDDHKTQLVVIYDDVFIGDSIEIIKKLKENQKTDSRIKVYVFCNGQYPYTEDFDEVADFVELCALPDAIYKAYQNVLPKTKRQIVPTLDDDAVGGEDNLFNKAQ